MRHSIKSAITAHTKSTRDSYLLQPFVESVDNSVLRQCDIRQFYINNRSHGFTHDTSQCEYSYISHYAYGFLGPFHLMDLLSSESFQCGLQTEEQTVEQVYLLKTTLSHEQLIPFPHILLARTCPVAPTGCKGCQKMKPTTEYTQKQQLQQGTGLAGCICHIPASVHS